MKRHRALTALLCASLELRHALSHLRFALEWKKLHRADLHAEMLSVARRCIQGYRDWLELWQARSGILVAFQNA